MTGWARVVTVAVIIAFFIVIFLGLALGSSVSKKPDASRPEQCELLATTTDPHAAMLEPQNTWSNFGYLLAGLLVLYRSRTLLGAAVGLNLAFEFLFSGLYHAKLNETMQTIDVAWIYVLLLAMIAYAVQSLFLPKWALKTGYPVANASVLTAVGIAVATVVIGVVMGIHKNDVFESTATTIALVVLLALLFLVALVVVIVRRARADLPPVDMSVVMPVVLIVSVGIPTLFFKFSDGPKHAFFNWCCPKAALQSHSAWHILSAVLVLVAYDFFANFSRDGRIFSFGEPAQEAA
jgi:hypothetical protein